MNRKEYLKEYHKKYRLENKDKLSDYEKEYRENNKEDISNYHKIYYEENKEKIKETSKSYYEENKDVINSINREYYKNNKDVINSKRKEYQKEYRENNKDKRNKQIKNRKNTNNLFKLTINIRSMINESIKKKRSKTCKILGCSFEEFKIYLESKFEPWMNWENYGKYNGELNYGWDIDHIIPLSSAKSEEDIIKLNHFTNLQPLCSKTNRYIKKNF